jgi:CheY-like chemotaxis protein
MSEPRAILVAEDDESDVLLLTRAFKEAGVTSPVQFAPDGQDAIDRLQQQCRDQDDRMPALVILDLKMPRKNGLETLHWIRQQAGLRCLPVIIFSSSARREDVEQAYLLGANAYLVKPASTVQRTELARFIKEWIRLNQVPIACSEGYKLAQAGHASRDFVQSPGM